MIFALLSRLPALAQEAASFLQARSFDLHVACDLLQPLAVRSLSKAVHHIVTGIDQAQTWQALRTRYPALVTLWLQPAVGVSPEPAVDLFAALADEIVVADDTASLEARLTDCIRRRLRAAQRPDWDLYFMQIALVVADRSNCLKRKVAALIVKDLRIIATGYNGTPRGAVNCNEGGCPRCNDLAPSGQQLDICLCSHAEENAIVQAAYHGTSVKDGTLYSTFSPCLQCSKMIINSGIATVVYLDDYPLAQPAQQLLGQCRLTVRRCSLPAASL